MSWSLPGKAPEPQKWVNPKPNPDVKPSETHTGTDPHGRAIGPKEDHKAAKLDADGLSVPQAAEKRKRDAAKAKAKAKA